MSRFSGPQNCGASRQLHNQRRTEAEDRQVKERARDEARAATYEEPTPLTDEELVALLRAGFAAGPSRALIELLLKGEA